MLEIALKDLRLLLRDPFALFWTLGFPLVFATFFGTVLRGAVTGDARAIPIVFTDEDGSPRAHALRAALVAHGGVTVTDAAAASGADAVRLGRAVAFVRVPPAWGKADLWRPDSLTLVTDPSRIAEARLVEGLLAETTRRVLLSEAGAPVDEVTLVRVASAAAHGARPGSAYDLVLAAAVLWGLLGCAATFAIGIVTERTRGTLFRLRAAPLGIGAVLGGKALACAIACLVDAASILVVGMVVFGARLDRPLPLALALLSVVACFTGLTMALSVTGRTERSVAGAGWATMVLMAMLGGGMVPLAWMPEWVAPLSLLSPVRWGIHALEGATWRELTLGELAPPLGVLWSVGVGSFGLGYWRLRGVDA